MPLSTRGHVKCTGRRSQVGHSSDVVEIAGYLELPVCGGSRQTGFERRKSVAGYSDGLVIR